MSRHPPFKALEASRPAFGSTPGWTCTQSPSPEWLPGTGTGTNETLAGVKEGLWTGTGGSYKAIDPETTPPAQLYKMMISAITPRPIGFCSSLSDTGIPNLAPFSYFNLVGHNPPMLMISFTHPTCVNIKATKQFSINIISEPFVEASNYTCIDAPFSQDEWKLSGLTPVPSTHIKPPRVGESAFSMECELEMFYDMYDPKDASKLTSTMVLGRVKLFHAREDIIDDTLLVDTAALQPVSRLGGISYGRTTAVYETPRPVWKVETERDEVKAIIEAQKSENKL